MTGQKKKSNVVVNLNDTIIDDYNIKICPLFFSTSNESISVTHPASTWL